MLEDSISASGPEQRFWIGIVNCQILIEGRAEFGLGMKYAAPDAMGGQVPKAALHQVEPRRAGGGDMKMEPRVAPLPGLDLGVFVRGVVGADDMDLPASRSGLPDQLQTAQGVWLAGS